MLLGIDVGGTHTDAVLIDNGGIVASHKVATNHGDLFLSINEALEKTISTVDKSKIRQINLSTTLSTNAIVENRLEEVGLFISSGPGINPANFSMGKHSYLIDGSIDHRGTEILGLNQTQVERAVDECKRDGVSVFALVSKFATRNTDHETSLGESVSPAADFCTFGHQVSGQLSFPRRICTAYYNSAVWRLYNSFIDSIEKSLANHGINPKINILKADGGTMPLVLSRKFPVESILSGPAASIMGIISLCDITEDSIILDIGGTTTDIAIFADGAPLIERDGISINSHPTLVRSLKTRSIGIGGDSSINVNGGTISVGPERMGPSMADGGIGPTLVDALNYTGIISYGNTTRSSSGIVELAKRAGISPEELAEKSVDFSVNSIRAEVDALIDEVNNRPVYTIHEMLEGKKIIPRKIYLMGGPARAFVKHLGNAYGLDVVIPENYDVANAIGAALARVTFNAELFADTGKGELVVPNLNIRQQVPRNYSVTDAENDAKKFLMGYLLQTGTQVHEGDIEIIESASFKMVQGYISSGKDIRVKCQIKPGVIMPFGRGGSS